MATSASAPEEPHLERIAHRLQPVPLTIETYNPLWPTHFTHFKALITTAFLSPPFSPSTLLSVSHVGSTSVPGLPAKPVIDIDVVVADILDEAAYVGALAGTGWEKTGLGEGGAGLQFLFREPGWHQHRFFVCNGDPCWANVHVFGPDCPETERHRVFREYLIEHPEDRELYANTKRAAAKASREAGEKVQEYNNRKEPVILEILDRAYKAQGLLK